MKILWIPHAPWEALDGQREAHIINELKLRHDIHVLTWSYNHKHSRSYFLHPAYYLRLLRVFTRKDGPVTLHHIPTLPHFVNFFARDKSHPFFLNAAVFRWFASRLHRRERYDAVICGTIHWMFGDLPEFPGARVYFDYLDAFHDWQVESIAKTTGSAMCVSHYLMRQARGFYDDTLYSPNGVYLDRLRNANGDQARKALGLEGKTVVSLIGLTCSNRYYFLDALKKLQAERADVVFLMVGAGAAKIGLENYARQIGLRFLSIGKVPSTEVAQYFAATDVGIYPGEKNAVYDGACPIKVLEYTAAGKPVVSSFTWELNHLNFPNVLLAEPETEDFLAKLRAAVNYRGAYPDMTPYSWQSISAELEGFLCR